MSPLSDILVPDFLESLLSRLETDPAFRSVLEAEHRALVAANAPEAAALIKGVLDGHKPDTRASSSVQ